MDVSETIDDVGIFWAFPCHKQNWDKHRIMPFTISLIGGQIVVTHYFFVSL
jgi:hypothetical protein